jgi:hypothetical protein
MKVDARKPEAAVPDLSAVVLSGSASGSTPAHMLGPRMPDHSPSENPSQLAQE